MKQTRIPPMPTGGAVHSRSHGSGCACGHCAAVIPASPCNSGDTCGCGEQEEAPPDDDGNSPRPACSGTCGCRDVHSQRGGAGGFPSENPNREASGSLLSAGKQIYILENLGCANCAAKMESKIKALPGVQHAAITFATKQLQLSAQNHAELLPHIREICASIEPEVRVLPRPAARDVPAKENPRDDSGDLRNILTGAALFAAGLLLGGRYPLWASAAFLAAYLVLGGQILLRALRGLRKGRVFDENFLMSVATLGAVAIREFPEAAGVMLFYRVGEYFERRAVEKSRGQILAAVDLRPEVVTLAADGETFDIPAEDARAGDIFLVRPGDRIPLDGVVLEGESRIDTSPVTGEPVPRSVAPGSEVLSGCVNTCGLLKIRAEKPLADSMATRILDSVENAAAQKPKIDRFITRFARVYTPAVLAAALAVAILPPLFGGAWRHWVYTALTFLVISCPCALVLSVPLAFFSGIGAGSRKGILFRGGATLEALREAKAVVMDKTGTITKGDFTVQKILPQQGFTEGELLAFAAACETASSHPVAGSILAAAKERGIAPEAACSLSETAGQGISATLPQGRVLCGNKTLLASNGVAVPPSAQNAADTEVLVAVNGRYAGKLLIADTVKRDAASAVSAMERLGLHAAMLTGDTENRARAVADEVGIREVHAALLPEQKVEKLLSIRQERGAVLFVGDGINDAPVLAAANVGAAMGTGADAAIEVADVVFMTSDLQAVPQACSIAKDTCRAAVQNVVFALLVKAAVMVLGVLGYASMWMAVFADSGVAALCVLNSIRILYGKYGQRI